MSQNTRLIEKDILAAVPATSAGDSEIIDLFGVAGGADRFSCQAIYDVQTPGAKNFTDTDVNITANTVTVTAHGYSTGFKVQLTTTGTLPAPLTILTDYFLIVVNANTLKFATTLANALAGTAIDITTQGSAAAIDTITGVTLASASVTFRKSNDGVNFIDVQTATSITVDGSVMIEQPNTAYRYFKVVKALTSGQVATKALILVLGDGI